MPYANGIEYKIVSNPAGCWRGVTDCMACYNSQCKGNTWVGSQKCWNSQCLMAEPVKPEKAGEAGR